MNSLRELQRAFADALRGNGATARRFVLANGIDPAARIAIYRNNAAVNWCEMLSAAYPVIGRLGGEDWFAQTAQQYMAWCPSRSGDRFHIGERFAEFLGLRLAGTPYEYFADVARLEWAQQLVLSAAAAEPLDLASLQHVPERDHGRLRFNLVPASRLVASPYPLLAIWKSNQPGSSGQEELRLDSGPSRLLVIRRQDHVEMHELPVADFALLQAFADGCMLSAAAAAVLHIDPDADLPATLGRCAGLAVLSGGRLALRENAIRGEIR